MVGVLCAGLMVAVVCFAPTRVLAVPYRGHVDVAVPPAHQFWMHNGSRMELEIAGTEWVLRYDAPRLAMRFHGWRAGDELFRGRIEGRVISGDIGRDSVTCGRTVYPASGWLSSDGKQIVMTAEAPVRATIGCDIKGTETETLVFVAEVD